MEKLIKVLKVLDGDLMKNDENDNVSRKHNQSTER